MDRFLAPTMIHICCKFGECGLNRSGVIVLTRSYNLEGQGHDLQDEGQGHPYSNIANFGQYNAGDVKREIQHDEYLINTSEMTLKGMHTTCVTDTTYITDTTPDFSS